MRWRLQATDLSKGANDMSDYPKFTWDKFPDMPPGFIEEFKVYARQMRYIPMPDPYVPSMSFEKFVELMRERRGVIAIDEPTLPRQRLAVSINPARKPLWVKEFEKWLKDNEK